MEAREEKALELFNNLSKIAIEEIQLRIKDGKLGTRHRQATRQRAEEFTYNKGLSPSISMQLSSEVYLEEEWDDGAFELRRWLIDYMDSSGVMASLTGLYPECADARNFILNFVNCYIYECFDGRVPNQAEINKNIAICINDLEKRPVRYKMTLWVNGVAIEGEEHLAINSTSLTLRNAIARDFEEGRPGNSMEQMMSSMVIDVDGRFINDYELQKALNLAITILRLYRAGGVRCNIEKRVSESMVNRGNMWLKGTRAGEASNEKYLLTSKDSQALKEFWDTCSKRLPEYLFDTSIPVADYRAISYKRYCDSLLMNITEEARIASVVMGLEALFLEGGQELSFRLRTRVGKLLGLLPRLDAKTLASEVKDAYVVRSKYVHGALLKEEEKKKMVERNGAMKDFIKELSNLLRISIVVFCFIDKEKGALLHLIDESLIDEKADSELIKTMEVLPEIPL